MLSTSHLLCLLHLRSVGRKTAHQIAAALPEAPSDALGMAEALASVAPRVKRFRPASADDVGRALEAGRDLVERSRRAGVVALGFFHPAFPERLRRIPDPPAVVYVKGEAAALGLGTSVAVVGTRRPTPEGAEWARAAGRWAAERGAVVSGLALGCDTAAHEGCVAAGGRGVAVLAHGLHTVSPASNRGLARAVLDAGGCLLSEYPLGTAARRGHFVDRDRLQSGLSDLVVVVETTAGGGTMHTARFAVAQGRPLAALSAAGPPEPCDERAGNRELVRSGAATPVATADELGPVLGQRPAPRREAQGDLFPSAR